MHVCVKKTFKKYTKINTKSGLQGFEVARRILDMNGLNNVDIVETKGELSDHYDPTRKVVRLSSDIYHGTSIASSSVAAHECGHAIQDKVGYVFLRIRHMLVPTVNLCSKLGYVVIFIGLLLGTFKLAMIGLILLGAILLFQLVTLPVEFNASRRALKVLDEYGILTDEENGAAKKVLGAAAMTYVASMLVALGSFLRVLMLFGRRRD